MARAEVPEGCRQVEFPDGSMSRVGDGHGMVQVSDRQAAMLRARNTDIKVVGTRIAISGLGPWLDCAHCPRSFLRPLDGSTETLCPRCREN